MNILYVSVQCSENKFAELFRNSKEIPGQQAQKYNRLLAEGLSLCEGKKVYALTAIPVLKENSHKMFFTASHEKVKDLNYHYLSAINIHRVRDILTVISSFFYSLWCIPRYNIEQLVVDVLAAPVALGSLLAAKLWHRKVVGIVTDVPNILFVNGDRAYHLVSNFIIRKVNQYVFLTEQMNELLNHSGKPYVVIEGLVDCKVDENECNISKAGQKILLYSGTIHKQYGIKTLTEAFVDAELEDVELHIYGTGDYQEELQRLCEEHSNIKYFGCVLNTDMIKLQKRATVLINPRSEKEEFTKYSFPSKNMEYLLSGIPVMAALLPGMSEEYRDYMYVIEDCSCEGICSTLRKVFSNTPQELHEKGQRARQFVLNNKNNVRQAERLISLLETRAGGTQ